MRTIKNVSDEQRGNKIKKETLKAGEREYLPIVPFLPHVDNEVYYYLPPTCYLLIKKCFFRIQDSSIIQKPLV